MSATQQSRETTRADGSTQVVMLGTGTPRPDPNCAGPATVVVANNTAYLIDFGPGVIRRASAAYENGVKALGYGGVNIKTAFLTHMHSDHTIGYPDLILTPWVMGRSDPLTIYSPKGIKAMTENILKAWQIDIDVRSNSLHGNSAACNVFSHEIVPGLIYTDANVTVTAFPARHEDMVDSFGFRFETPHRTIVISGDTIPTQALIDHSRGCDILIHEAYSMASFREVPSHWQKYRQRAHTSSFELAEIANTVKPELLVIYQRSNAGGTPGKVDIEDVLIEEVRQVYKGTVVAAHDLDIF